MDWTKLFFSPEGRIGRQPYWIGWLVLFAVNFFLSWTVILPLVAIYSWICISVKRFHDMGKSGWLAAIPVVIGFVAPVLAVLVLGFTAVAAGVASGGQDETVAAAMLSAVGGAMLFFLVGGLVSIGFLIWQGVAEGDPNENRYGPPPAPGI